MPNVRSTHSANLPWLMRHCHHFAQTLPSRYREGVPMGLRPTQGDENLWVFDRAAKPLAFARIIR